MNPGCLDKAGIEDALMHLAASRDVFAPVREGGTLEFRRLPAGGLVFLGPEKTLLPLKTLYLPMTEDVFSRCMKAGETGMEIAAPMERDRVVFGALGCDIATLHLLDPVLLGEPPDEAYRERRERTAIVALACKGEGPECFCSSCDIDPACPGGSDVVLTDVGDAFLFDALTEKGSRILETLDGRLREATDDELATARSFDSTAADNIPLAKIPEDFADLWEADLWDDLASRCIGCGVCTLLCPTCYCFDVQDEQRGTESKRFKTWDSCMFSEFTRMAGGDNPRDTKRSRVRQRFLHKLQYYSSEHGKAACVGCGRCRVHCPVGIGIDEVITRLARGKVPGEVKGGGE